MKDKQVKIVLLSLLLCVVKHNYNNYCDVIMRERGSERAE